MLLRTLCHARGKLGSSLNILFPLPASTNCIVFLDIYTFLEIYTKIPFTNTLIFKGAHQKSVHRPFLSQSPYLVGSGSRPPRRGPPHSLPPMKPLWGSTNMSSCSISSSSTCFEWHDSPSLFSGDNGEGSDVGLVPSGALVCSTTGPSDRQATDGRSNGGDVRLFMTLLIRSDDVKSRCIIWMRVVTFCEEGDPGKDFVSVAFADRQKDD